MGIGIRTVQTITSNVAVTSSTALVTTGLTIPVVAGQVVHVRAKVYFSVGAAGGCRFQWVVPAAPGSFINAILLSDTVTPAEIPACQTSSAAFTNALAAAGTHFMDLELHFVNGVNAGNVDLQVAQNTSNATPITVLVGSTADVISE